MLTPHRPTAVALVVWLALVLSPEHLPAGEAKARSAVETKAPSSGETKALAGGGAKALPAGESEMLPAAGPVGYGFNEVTFATLSDLHLGLHETNTFKRGADSERLLQTAIDALNADRDLDFVLLPGDLLTDGEPWNLDRLHELLASLRVPYYVVPGNHDQPVVPGNPQAGPFHPGVSRTTFLEAFRGHGIDRSDRGYWSIDPLPGLHLVGLDTVRTGTWKGEVDAAQRRWLEADLTGNPDKLTLILSHHGFLPFVAEDETDAWASFQVDNAGEMRALFARHPQVQAVISGHHHLWAAKTAGRCHYFSVPSLTSYPLAYVRFSVSPERIEAQVLRVGTDADRAGARAALLADPFWNQGLSEAELLKTFEGPSSSAAMSWFPWTPAF